MAYKIRYGSDRNRQHSSGSLHRGQFIGSCILALLSWVIAFLKGGTHLLSRLFSAPPTSVTEQAVAVFADALYRGEGWYRGLAVWCRTIIDGGTV